MGLQPKCHRSSAKKAGAEKTQNALLGDESSSSLYNSPHSGSSSSPWAFRHDEAIFASKVDRRKDSPSDSPSQRPVSCHVGSVVSNRLLGLLCLRLAFATSVPPVPKEGQYFQCGEVCEAAG